MDNNEAVKYIYEMCESAPWKKFVLPALRGKRNSLINEWLTLDDPTSMAAAELRGGIRAIDIFLSWQGSYDKAVESLKTWKPIPKEEDSASGGPY